MCLGHRKRMIRAVVLSTFFCFWWVGLSNAHPIPFSYLDLRISEEKIDASLVAHIIDIAHELELDPPDLLLESDVTQEYADEIAAFIGSRLSLVSGGRELLPVWSSPEVLNDRRSIRLYFSYDLEAAIGSVVVSSKLFPYDPKHQTFLNVYEDNDLRTQAILDFNHDQTEYFAGTWQGTRAVIFKFIPQGIHHILIGRDDILFLVGLLLLGGDIIHLLIVVTAFTIAHSVTLSLAVLNVFNPPANLVEPAIALSIV